MYKEALFDLVLTVTPVEADSHKARPILQLLQEATNCLCGRNNFRSWIMIGSGDLDT